MIRALARADGQAEVGGLGARERGPLRVWVSAGDVSGDAIGAEFVRAFAERRPEARFVGLGGDEMQRAGVQRIADQRALAVGGLFEWLPGLAQILRTSWRVAVGLRDHRPDLYVVIDSGGFHLPFMRLARALAPAPILYYVAPQVWAWRAGRVPRIAARADRIAVIWPFESSFWGERGVATDFVGHPILDRAIARPRPENARRSARASLGLPLDRPLVGLFPGSRRNEVARHLPAQLGALARLRADRPEVEGVVVRAPSMGRERIVDRARRAGFEVPRIVDAGPDGLDAIDVAVAKPGTVTLELMLRECPMVVTGRAHPLSVALFRRQFRGQAFALPNLIAGEEVVPELLQEAMTADRIAERVAPLLPLGRDPSGPARDQLRALRGVRACLGEPGASRRTAILAEEMLGTHRA